MIDAACYAIINLSSDSRRPQIVLVQDNDKNPGNRPDFRPMWKLPGGKFEPVEGDVEYQDAVIREVFEEIGVSVILGDLFYEDFLSSRRGRWYFKVWVATATPPIPTELPAGSEIARIKLFGAQDLAWESNGGILPNHLKALNQYAERNNWWK